MDLSIAMLNNQIVDLVIWLFTSEHFLELCRMIDGVNFRTWWVVLSSAWRTRMCVYIYKYIYHIYIYTYTHYGIPMHAYTHLLMFDTGNNAMMLRMLMRRLLTLLMFPMFLTLVTSGFGQVPLQPSQPSVRDAQPGLRGSHRVTWQTGFIPPAAQNKGAYPLVI